jgi:hypothetical protein
VRDARVDGGGDEEQENDAKAREARPSRLRKSEPTAVGDC